MRFSEAPAHRTFTHTVSFALLLAVGVNAALRAASNWLPILGSWTWLGFPLGLGCVIHVLGDACTRSGVPLLWPLRIRGRRWRRFGAPIRFTTGGRGEQVAVGLCFALGAGAVWSLYTS